MVFNLRSVPEKRMHAGALTVPGNITSQDLQRSSFMKKFIPFVVLAVFLAFSLSVSAEYLTFYDVIGDVMQLLGSDPDAAWNMSRSDAEAAANALNGFSCESRDDALVCTKSHWTGEFEITLYFAGDKLAGTTCVMTGPTIQDLNWQPGASYIFNVEDLTGRLKSFGMLTDSTPQQTGAVLFPDPAVSTYSPVYAIGSKSLLQPGYLAKSASNSKFRLAFIAASDEFTDAEISLPAEPAAEPEDINPAAEAEAEPAAGASSSSAGTDAGLSLTVSANEIEVGETAVITVSAPGADGIRLYEKYEYGDYEMEETSGDSLEYRMGASSVSSDTFYAVASYNGVWSETRSNEETINFLATEVLKVSFPEKIRAGEIFDFCIYEGKDNFDYIVSIYDAEGTVIRENHVTSGYTDQDPLPEGEYRLTVRNIGKKDSYIAEGNIVVSGDTETGYLYGHEGRPVTDSDLTPGSSAGLEGEKGPELIEGVWTLISTVDDNDYSPYGDVRKYQTGNDGSWVNSDELYFQFNNDGTFGRLEYRIYESTTVVGGTWIQNGNYFYLTLIDGTYLGVYYVSDDTGEMTVAVSGNIQLVFKRNENAEQIAIVNRVMDQYFEAVGDQINQN